MHLPFWLNHGVRKAQEQDCQGGTGKQDDAKAGEMLWRPPMAIQQEGARQKPRPALLHDRWSSRTLLALEFRIRTAPAAAIAATAHRRSQRTDKGWRPPEAAHVRVLREP